MPITAGISELFVHLLHPFRIGCQEVSYLTAIFISALTVVLQSVKVVHVDGFMSEVTFKHARCFDLNGIRKVAVGPDF